MELASTSFWRCLIKFKTMLVRKSEFSYYRLRFQLDFSILPWLSWATLSDICYGNSMCCWSVTAIVKRINIFTDCCCRVNIIFTSCKHPKCREEIQFPIPASLLSPAGGWALIVIWKVNWITTRARQCQSGAGNMILQFTHFHNFSSLLQTLIYYFTRIRKFLMTVWQYYYDSMTAWPRTWLHHCMTDPLHAKFRRSGKKTWPPGKIASQIWTPKNQDASLHSTFWSRPCIGLLLCSWNVKRSLDL